MTNATVESSRSVEIYTFYHRDRLIGHIVWHNGTFKAYTWPDEVIIGSYSSLEKAASAIREVSYDGDPEGWNTKPVLRRCEASSNQDQLFQRLGELDEYHEVKKFCAMIRYLQWRGFDDDSLIKILEAVLGSDDKEDEDSGDKRSD